MPPNFRQVAKVADEMKRDRMQYAPNFFLYDGEEAKLYFNGTASEPYLNHDHTISLGGNKFLTLTCAQGHEGHLGCVPCFAYQRNDKRVGKPTPKATFNVADSRWFHKETTTVKFRGQDSEKTSWTACTYDEEVGGKNTCDGCKKKLERSRGGQKKYSMSMMWAQALSGANDIAAKRCRSCKKGKIKVLGYKDAKGREVDVDDPTDLPEGVTEILACSGCKSPERGSIFDVPILVKRTGGGKSTAYSFNPIMDEFGEQPDWLDDLEPWDLPAVCKPMSAKTQAEKLGIDNPFAGGPDAASTSSYTEDMDDDTIMG
jgi:hypothetical protein